MMTPLSLHLNLGSELQLLLFLDATNRDGDSLDLMLRGNIYGPGESAKVLGRAAAIPVQSFGSKDPCTEIPPSLFEKFDELGISLN
jgi:hypothetical protein